MYYNNLKKCDEAVWSICDKEFDRQQNTIELIASENIVSEACLMAMSSVFTNKYAEGYPSKRYYGGCEFADEIENLAIKRATKLFNCKYANVQPHSGSQANYAALAALINPGDHILSLSLSNGGHLTHGSPVNFSGSLYQVSNYGLDENGYINYNEIKELVISDRPSAIIIGASAYSRIINFQKVYEMVNEGIEYLKNNNPSWYQTLYLKKGLNRPYIMADIAHIAGLVATGLHPSPFPWVDVVTSTTHKTLRGPRGGLILSNSEEIAKKIDKAVFPGSQGGPLLHVIAAKAVAFGEALKPEFKKYQQQVLKNMQAMAEEFAVAGIPIVSGGTDNHLLVLDLSNTSWTGKDLQIELEKLGIATNKNTIPNEKLSPMIASGLRIGTAAITTRGMKEKESREIAKIIILVIINQYNINEIKNKVKKICDNFLVY